MKNAIKILFTLLICMSSIALFAQIKPPLMQHLSNPSHLYPALSGWHGATSVNANYRNQWPGIPATYTSYILGFDHYSNKYKTAVSANFSHDRQGSGIVNTNRAEFSISPKITLKNGLTFMPSATLHSFQVSIDYDQLTIMDPAGTGLVIPFDPALGSPPRNYLSVGAGMAITYHDAFLAFQMNELDNPEPIGNKISNGSSEIQRNMNVVIGKIFTKGDFKITPTITYWQYAVFNQFMVGLSGQYKRWIIGSRLAPNNFLGFSAGYDLADRLRFSYNYDHTISRLGTQTLGSHELSLRLMLRKKHVNSPFLSELPIL